MKNSLLFLFCVCSYCCLFGQHTFSICAVDTLTGEVGSAGASCLDAATAGGNSAVVISSVHPGTGVIHTQAAYDPVNQLYADQLMNQGLSPQQIVDSLLANDNGGDVSQRQYGIVALVGGHALVAGYTGTGSPLYYNQILGKGYAVQGNTLLGTGIIDSMEARFLRTPGDLACKLMAAMQGAKVVGADSRCSASGNSSLSSFLRLACPSDQTGKSKLDLVVSQGPKGFEPIDSLQKLFNIVHPSCSVPLNCTIATLNGLDLADLVSLRMHPNPFSDWGVLELNSVHSFDCFLEVFSITGQLVYSDHTTNLSSWRITKNNLAGSGMYFYKMLISGKSLRTGKFIVL
jgi:uncharacterized Ntn-hydrolase superfamily protein